MSPNKSGNRFGQGKAIATNFNLLRAAGIGPENRFWERLRYSKFAKLPTSGGMAAVKLLSIKQELLQNFYQIVEL